MSKFQPIQSYNNKSGDFQLLPFRFAELDAKRYVATNLAGEYVIVPKYRMPQIVAHELENTDPLYIELRAKHFLTDDRSEIAKDLLAIKVRTRYRRLADFTGLHMFVVTLRCEHSCPYCQVSRQSQDKAKFDMSFEDASAAINLALRSPSPNIKIEFQGGEPLLNFDLIQYVVKESKRRNSSKNLAFVIATNLALIDKQILRFCKEHDVHISTSLDGPEDLHNRNRPRPGRDSYQRATQGIHLVREMLGRDKVSALMTTTEHSFGRVKDIVDEYLSQQFDGIFLRPLSPYGFAIKTRSFKSYNSDRWLEFYKSGIEYIIDLNRKGVPFREYYAATILAKMFTSIDPGYVDLMSPSGIGIGAVVYNYDGSVYASDESRMLAEMGEQKFKLGHVQENTYEEIFLSENLLAPLEESFSYSVPMCHDCAFELYCGADPVFHWARHKDFIGRKPESEFCRRNMTIFKYLIARMDEDRFVKRLFCKWANEC